MKKAALLFAIPLLLAFTTPVVVEWTAIPDKVLVASRAPGAAGTTVHGWMVPKWHVYSLAQKAGGPKALSFELEPFDGFSIGEVTGPKPQTAYDAEFKMKTETYSGFADFKVPIRWTKPLRSSTTHLKLVIRYMACSDKLCLPPRKEVLNLELVAPGAK
jgi:hypothetical protein